MFLVSSDDFYTLGGGVLGDINGDGLVNMLDVGEVSARWTRLTGPLGYDSNADINGGFDKSGQQIPGAPDGCIGMVDLSLVSAYWTGPPKGPLDP